MKTKKVRRLKPGPLLNVARSMGRWHPQDDYLLIQAVMQLMSLEDVHKTTKFSHKFTQQDISDRWHAVLYDLPISKMIYKNLKKLHFDDVIRLKRKAPFSRAEDIILLNVPSTVAKEKLDETFEKLLLEHRDVFHEGRTAESLKRQWKTLRKLKLLVDQEQDLLKWIERTSPDNEENKKMSNYLKKSFKEIENELDDQVIDEHVQLNDDLETEMSECYENLLKEIQRGEAELFMWQILIDKVTNTPNPFMNAETRAVLFFGQQFYSMNKSDITLGRRAASAASTTANIDEADIEENLDVDLSKYVQLKKNRQHNADDKNYEDEEEEAEKLATNLRKISRNQCKISMISPENILIYNNGKLAIHVDGKVLPTKTKTQLYDKSFIEIGDFRILFIVNLNLVAKHAAKMSSD